MKSIVFNLLFLILTMTSYGQNIPFTDARWTVSAQQHMIENFKGKTSLYLLNGSATLNDVKFENGVIEFDIYLTRKISFAGVAWRVNGSTYEHFYLRSHRLGLPDSYQYNPVLNGNSGWQLYHDQYTSANDGLLGYKPIEEGLGYNGILHLDYDTWTHVKLVVAGNQAEVYFNNEDNPSIFVKKLNINPEGGELGITSAAGSVHFANFSYSNNPDQVLKSKGSFESKTPEGSITQWEVSEPIDESTLADGTLSSKFLNGLKFQKVASEEGGLLNISRIHSRNSEKRGVLVKATINSESNGLKKIEFGYSDDVMVFFDGKAVYQGTNGYRSRDFRYLGTIGYFDAVFLPLKRGANEVIFLVSESFGGWGIKAKTGE